MTSMVSRASSATPAPPDVYSVRRVRAVVYWFGSGVAIGVTGGAVFGALLALMLDGRPLAAAAFGSVYGLLVGWPFGLIMGLSTAALRLPRTIDDHVFIVRRNGVILLGAAGLVGAAMWPVLVLAAMVGAAMGWAAAPRIIRVSVTIANGGAA